MPVAEETKKKKKKKNSYGSLSGRCEDGVFSRRDRNMEHVRVWDGTFALAGTSVKSDPKLGRYSEVQGHRACREREREREGEGESRCIPYLLR